MLVLTLAILGQAIGQVYSNKVVGQKERGSERQH